MKGVIPVLLWVAISSGVTTVAMAQGAGQSVKADKVAEKVKARGSEERMMPEPVVQLKRLAKGLQLTPEQQKQIKPVLENEYAKLKEIRQDEDLSPRQIQRKVETLRTNTIAKIQTYLTPEQQKKHAMVSDEIKANKQKRMKENRKIRLGTQADPAAQPR